jgi:LmbE family N-acetylglucosaminyl deacetylase
MIEDEFGGISLFALGLCGAQSPIYCEEGFDKMEMFADKVFSKISEMYENHKKLSVSPIEIRYREVKLELENPDFQLLYTLGILDRDYEKGKITSSVSKVRIGDLDLINIPGEPFPGLLTDVLKTKEGTEILVISHSNDSLGYFIPKNQWSLDPQVWVNDIEDEKFIGHETESIGVEAGQIIRKTIKELYCYKTVLAIGPHADDLTIWAGGTLIKLAKEGNDLICVRITDDYADCVGLTEERGRRRNKKETERAYKALGAKEIIHLGYLTDTLYSVDYHELRGKLVRLMRKYKPDVVVSFDLNGTDEENMDHVTTARAVNEACWQSSFDLFYPQHFEEGLEIHAVGERYLFARNPTILNFYVDITDYIDDKIKAINYQKTVMENWFHQNMLLARANNLYVELLEEDVPNPIRVTLLVKLVYGEIGEKYGVKYAEEFNRIDAGMLKDLAED